jgi:hypothetical protein
MAKQSMVRETLTAGPSSPFPGATTAQLGVPPPPLPGKAADVPAGEPRHRVSWWVFVLGILTFLAGAWLLFIEDGTQVRSTLQPLPPRSEAPAPAIACSAKPRVGNAAWLRYTN